MRIQHNIAAMNSYRNYNNNNAALNKNLEKLSSGYKINRAGDDAAGLAISEKMRAQITGLETAQKNVKDGISLVKTAEGAMQEIHDMLNRMEELATQSANGTYDDEVDRANLQKEVQSLQTEIDRIADSSNFNGIKLLNGDQSGISDLTFTQATASAAATLAVDFSNITGKKLLDGGSIQLGNTYISIAAASKASAATLSGTVLKVGASATASKIVTALKGLATPFTCATASGADATVTKVAATGTTITYTIASKGKKINVSSLPSVLTANGGLQLQIGDSSNSYDKIRVGVSNMHVKNLFMNNTVSVATQTKAAEAVDFIKSAINMVSSSRGDLGAVQNRLEHTQNNLSVMTENIQDAESTIRDTDVAAEMMEYTKNNILIQSSQAMLAQSNQIPQGVLQLLQ